MPAVSPLLALGAAGALALLVVAISRPPLACGLLAVAVPLTAGMARGGVVPVLRVNEALLLVVAAGFTANWLARRRRLAFIGLDVVVLGFCLVGVVVPWAVILLSHAEADQSDWLLVLAPVQYLVVYLLFSRTEFTSADLNRLFNLCMVASLPVAAVAVGEALDLGGTRDLVSAYYPTAALPAWDTVYRPASLLGHYSALGAFGLLNFLLALALAATRHPGFSGRWLGVVMGANLLSLLASQTYAPVAALFPGAAAVVLGARRFPWRQAAAAPPVLAAAAVVFWPSITNRIASQVAAPGGSGLPETLQTRIDYWQAFFVPALLRHGLWFGTGTLMPPEVPRPLVDFVDNGYLWQLFRAGVPGLVVMIAMLAAVAAAGWAARQSDAPSRRMVGLTCLGAVIAVVLMDVTAEYLTFTAVSQEFWMLVGILAGFAAGWLPAGGAPGARLLFRAPGAVIVGAASRHRPLFLSAALRVRRLIAPGALLRSSAVLTLGNATARLLSLLFSVAAARFLAPAGYGLLAYRLVIANVGSILIMNAPLGLSRFLSRHRDDPPERDAYFTNWMLVVAWIVAASLALMIPIGVLAGLGGWLLPALLVNLLGTAVLQTYQQVQCGLERFDLMVGFWALANLLQLGAAVAAGLLGFRTTAVFLAIYGASSVAALIVALPLARTPVRFRPETLSWRRTWLVARYTAPLVLMNAFTTVWLGADLVLIDRLMSPAAAGRYAAAKVVVSGFAVVSWAVSTAVLPRASRLAGAALRSYLLRALALTVAAVVPLLLILSLAARPLVGLVFGSHYLEAGAPLAVLAAGMAVYALYMVVESAWLGLGRPGVAAIAGGVGMTGVLLGGILLIPRLGLTGAALAFGAGSVAQLLVLGALTVVSPRLRDGPGQPPASAEGAGALAEPASAPRRPVLVMAEGLTGAPDDGYARIVRTMAAGLGLRRPVVLHDMPGHRRGGSAGASIPWRTWGTLRTATRPEVRRARPAVLVYVSRSSVTVAALLRARLLKLVCRGVPVAVVGLHATSGRLPAPFALRHLAPDLLLVPTGRERDAGRAAGVYADTVCGGVDLDRFRPPRPGERAHLRQRWRLPVRDRLILHVGHLREGRNLPALAPLAHSAGVTVVVADTGHGRSESKQLRSALEGAGVVVMDGCRPNVEELYRLADCFIFPAVSPDDAVALPLCVLEALASDLPVVTTRFGAVAERFGQTASVTFVDSPAEIPERALAACGSAARSRDLVEPYTWDALAQRLAALFEEVERSQGAGGAPASAVLAARLRRQAHVLRELPRSLLWDGHTGYEVQRTSTVPVVPFEDPAPAPELTRPRTATVGVVTPPAGSSLVAAAARLLGLSPEEADLPGARSLLDRALLGRWELVAASAEAVPALSAAAGALAAYVGRGGTLYVDGLDEHANLVLPALGAQLGIALPSVRRALAATRLLLPPAPAAFAGALAGTALETSCGEHVLEPAHPRDVRAWGVARGVRGALVMELHLGRGRVVLSTLPRTQPSRAIDVLASPEAAGLVVPLLLLHQRYGRAAWHAPCAIANFTIDDPPLRRGSLGLRYDILAAQARDHRFHVTIATVPRELPLADTTVVGRLRQQPELLSACYHGCDHDGYEFYLTAGSRMRYPARPLAEQRADLRRAVERGQRFASTHGCRLDRVMVFPHGVGPASLYPDLHRLGFLATCNFWDKYPLEAAVPAQDDLGLRPADLAWEGFPLLWRRSIRDQGCLLDLMLGRPVLVFAHRRGLGRDFLPFVERAAAINRASRGTAAWCGLEDVARHAYLQRRAPGQGWEVLMTTNEACLHNPDPAPRTWMVTRPSLPQGSLLETAGLRGPGPLRVTVPAGGTAVVRVTTRDGVSPLGSARRCSVVGGDRKEVCA